MILEVELCINWDKRGIFYFIYKNKYVWVLENLDLLFFISVLFGKLKK